MADFQLINEGPHRRQVNSLRDRLWRITSMAFQLHKEAGRLLDELEALANTEPKVAERLSAGRTAVLRFVKGSVEGLLDDLDFSRDHLPPQASPNDDTRGSK